MIDNIDDLKLQWQKIDPRPDDLEKANRLLSQSLAMKRASSAQETLARYFSRIKWVGFALIIYAPFIYFVTELMDVWTCMLFVVYGLMMTILNSMMASYIKETPLIELPVSQAIIRATKIREYQNKMRIAGICGAAVVVISFMCSLLEQHHTGAAIGAAVGLAIGLAIAIPRCIYTSRLTRRMIDTLSDKES